MNATDKNAKMEAINKNKNDCKVTLVIWTLRLIQFNEPKRRKKKMSQYDSRDNFLSLSHTMNYKRK